MSNEQPRRTSLSHDLRIFLLTLAAGTPAVVVALVLLWTGGLTEKVQWTLTVFVTFTWIGLAFVIREQVVHPLQMISNMLAALHEGDYSIRARPPSGDDALGLAMLEVNTLGDTLRKQRFDAVEATALLAKIMEA